MDSELCEKWEKSPKNTNPLTGRRIKSDGKTAMSLDRKCKKYFNTGDIEFGDYIFVKKSAHGDGSCFFHSITRLYLDSKSRRKGLKLRTDIAESLTLKKYTELGNGLLAKMTMFAEHPIEVTPYEFDNNNILQIIRTRRNYPQLKKDLYRQFEKYKAKFLNTHVYADEYMVDYTARYLRINIIVVGDNGTVTSGRKLVKRYPSVFVYNYFDRHYEPLVGVDGDTMFGWRDTKEILVDANYVQF